MSDAGAGGTPIAFEVPPLQAVAQAPVPTAAPAIVVMSTRTPQPVSGSSVDAASACLLAALLLVVGLLLLLKNGWRTTTA